VNFTICAIGINSLRVVVLAQVLTSPIFMKQSQFIGRRGITGCLAECRKF